MDFVSIFTDGDKNLWAVIYESNDSDIFRFLFDKWNDTEYLLNFFRENKEELEDPFWEGITINQAVDRILDEAYEFENQLWSIETKQLGFEKDSLQNVFVALHSNIYSLNWKNERDRKARLRFSKSMLRIYAIELDDFCLIVTGGTIKLTKKMEGERFEAEFRKLESVKSFLRAEGISDKDGLTYL